MSLAAKITTGVAVVVVVGLVALAVPAFISLGQVAAGTADGARNLAGSFDSTPEPAAVAVAEPDPIPRDPKQAAAWEAGCDDFVDVGRYYQGEKPERPDRGATEYAAGTVTFNEKGGVATYTVAEGDSGMSIGERFCVDYITLYIANQVQQGTLHPGQVLNINP